jgi:hypothetical protein
LYDISAQCSGLGHIARIAVGAARRRSERKAGAFQAFGNFGRERNTLRRASRIVDENGLLAGTFGGIEDQRRTDLSDRGGAVTFIARKLEDRYLIEVIAGKMLVDIAEHRIAFQKMA